MNIGAYSLKIMFCDEITGELDSSTANRIMNLLKEINENEGVTIVFVTHNHDISSRCNRIITLKDGKVTSDKSGS